MNFYPFHIGDYMSHTNHLSDLEDLAYRRMIDLYYLSEQPFNDRSTIARKIRSTPEIVDNILNEFFTLEDDGCWHNKRIDEEIAKYHDRLSQASRAGKASAERRFKARSTTVQLTKNQEPLTNNHIIEVAKAPKAKRLDVKELPQEWEKFCKDTRPDLNPKDVFDQFRDYWVAQGGQKGAKLDWLATWRNWVRNQKQSVRGVNSDKSWMFSNQGIEQKANELGISTYGVATHAQLKDKIMQVLAKRSLE